MAEENMDDFIGGLRQPSVIDQLKRILNQYPDDGQILKELIQNAEDAGASQIKFMYDERKYPTADLLTDNLREFQGEALYSYNNAVFEKKDWKGIGQVFGSVKEEDSMKIGRFGLGFKSVFHITDLPTILSGNCLGLIDPLCKNLPNGKSTDGVYLDKDKTKVTKYKNQLKPYVHDLFHCSDQTFEEGFYKGTLFRFPLRKVASKLSDTIYGEEKIAYLFKMFTVNADLNILFLTKLESIELYIRKSGKKPKPLFLIQISDDCIEEVRKNRKLFLDGIRKSPKHALTITYHVRLHITDHRRASSGAEVTESSQWLVTHYFDKGNPTSAVHQLSTSLGYLPWVGMAVSVDSKETVEDLLEPQGQLFCFLPLPLEKKSPTGFPFHVHGYFAVEENRRHLKWPGAEQNDNELADKSLQWNMCLVKELLPCAVVHSIQYARDFLTTADVYKIIPNPTTVHENWKKALFKILTKVFEQKVIHSEAGWTKLSNAVLCKNDEQVLIDVLKKADLKPAVIPDFIHKAIDLVGFEKKCVSPKLISSEYRCLQNKIHLDRDNKITILEYLLNAQDESLLEKLKILPLDNCNFTAFVPSCDCSEDNCVYVPTEKHHRELFPGLDVSLLSTNIPNTILKRLECVAQRGYTNLKMVGEMDAVRLIRRVFPSEWKMTKYREWAPGQNGHPTNHYLQVLWRYLKENFPDDISMFTDLYVVPSSSTHLYKLSTDLPLLQKCHNIDTEIATAFGYLGVICVEIPEYVQQHPQLKEFVEQPSVSGFLKALEKAALSYQNIGNTMAKFAKSTTDTEKRCLRSFLSNGTTTLYTTHKTLLSHLPIFETMNGKFVNIVNVNYCMPVNYNLPVDFSVDLIDDSKTFSKEILNALGVTKMGIGVVLTKFILPKAEDVCSQDQFRTLMIHILSHLQEYKKDTRRVVAVLSEMKIVTNGAKKWVQAKELFDPTDHQLTAVFRGQDVFPSDEFRGFTVVHALKEVGLKTANHITASDLLAVIDHLAEKPEKHNQEEDEEKAKAFLQYLEKNKHYLHKHTSRGPLASELKKKNWVPVMLKRPAHYPSTLPWYKGKLFESPVNVKSVSLAHLVGSTMPTTNLQSGLFDWTNSPGLDIVVRHFGHLVKWYNKHSCSSGSDEESEKMHDFRKECKEMAMIVYHYMADMDDTSLLDCLKRWDLTKWIWQGEGFSSIDCVVLNKTFVEMQPYLFYLPNEMTRFKSLFLRCGMKETCDEKDLLNVMWQIKRKYDIPVETDIAEVVRNRQICIHILNHFKLSEDHKLSEIMESNFPIPIHSDSSSHILEMAPIHQCAYTENDGIQFDEQDVFLIHSDIPKDVARRLGIRSLTSHLLDVDEIDMSYGQSEPLTRRLKTLLKDYTDGLAIPKELIQNADDAGATEVCILYDERENLNAMSTLIDPNMKSCQGPALWVFNDSVFSDEDFENITKLSGATKEEQVDKIGRFGLGFNAVYNLTDVPSFVSRENIVILDPHTIHLGNVIRNKLKPGIKINMAKQFMQLKRWKDQFHPYEGIFGFHIPDDGEDDKEYKGTLFRFPLRTAQQAAVSEISQLHYSSEEVKALLNMMVNSASDVLLFTQNVLSVSIYHLQKNRENAADQVIELFCARKKPVQICRHLPTQLKVSLPHPAKQKPVDIQQFIRQCSILRAASSLKKLKKGKISVNSSMIIDIPCNFTDKGMQFFERHESQIYTWLICLQVAGGEALSMFMKDPSLVPVAGVAAPLKREHGKFILDQMKHEEKRQLFCFMPLPIVTNMPVHLNGYFAVTSSRQHLQMTSIHDKDAMSGVWNERLIRSGVCQSYILLLEVLTDLMDADKVDPFAFWPVKKPLQPVLEIMWKQLYASLSDLSSEGKRVYSDGKRWVQLKDCAILDVKLRDSSVGDKAVSICRRFYHKAFFIQMPENIYANFQFADCISRIQELEFSMMRFFSEVFIPNIEKIDTKVRNDIVLFGISSQRRDIHVLLKNSKCIPTNDNNTNLKKPAELIHPFGKVANLFSKSDGRFPNEDFICEHSISSRPTVLDWLEAHGMQADDLEWKDVVERARCLKTLTIKVGKERSRNLIKYINKKLSGCANQPLDKEAKTLYKIPFLFAAEKPNHFPVTWRGDRNNLHCPCELYHPKAKYLVGSTQLVVDESILPADSRKLDDLLKIRHEEDVPKEAVLQQLLHIQKVKLDAITWRGHEDLIKSFWEIYSYIQAGIRDGGNLGQLVKSCVVFQKGRFLDPKKVSFSEDGCVRPYLWSLNPDIAKQFRYLFQEMGVRDKFQMLDYVLALEELKANQQDSVLSDEDLGKVVQMLNCAASCVGDEITSIDFTLYMPDSTGRLQPSSRLCFSNCPWFQVDGSNLYCHNKISYATARALGVKSVREDHIEKVSFGIPFGQSEDLTSRIRRILQGYPCDKEILNELLQNADDAEATEIHFIMDFRNHGKKSVFEDSWKSLQGPSLSVYNNQPFSQSDLIGIQKLGEGSKATDPNKTGQYGVGFNCVYHMTDVPIILTSIENVETLCIMDPNCHYIPGATRNVPGRRFENLNQIRKTYKDVFECFLEEFIPIKCGTLFRLPLRTSEMAGFSQICKDPFTPDDLRRLVDIFKGEALSTMLFLNNIEKIVISEIDDNTQILKRVFEADAVISKRDQRKRKELSQRIQELSKEINQRPQSPLEVSKFDTTYNVELHDNKGSCQKWLIAQQLGFPEDADIPHIITEAFENGNLRLLPRGSCAVLLDKDGLPVNVDGKAFCFLPLPVSTNMPVHINGHFALSHENRRHLWSDDRKSYRSEWNDRLLCHVIASAYLTLLKSLKEMLFEMQSLPYGEVHKRLKNYCTLFPQIHDVNDQLGHLATYIYRNMKYKLLPVLHRKKKQAFLEWFPPTSEKSEAVYFHRLDKELKVNSPQNHAEDMMNLKHTLIRCGMRLIEMPCEVSKWFNKSGVKMSCLTPSDVVSFFRSFKDKNSLCKIRQLPVNITESPLENSSNLQLVYKHCEQEFKESLEDLPLLLTQDNVLRVFSDRSPVHASHYYDLFPHFHHKFVHMILLPFLTDSSGAFLESLSIFSIAEMLKSEIDGKLHSKPFVEWKPDATNKRWLNRLWSCLRQHLKSPLQNIHKDKISEELAVLRDLCIIPAAMHREKVLVAVNKSVIILDDNGFDINTRKLYSTLKKIGFLTHDNYTLIEDRIQSIQRSEFYENMRLTNTLATTANEPHRLLLAFGEVEQCGIQLNLKIEKKDALELLRYFSAHLEKVRKVEGSQVILKKLPFYITTYDTLITLTDLRCFRIPNSIPTGGMEVWRQKHSLTFIRNDPELHDLLEFLGCKELSVVDVYCGFIFNLLGTICEKAKLEHLTFLKTFTESSHFSRQYDTGIQRLYLSLKELELFPDESGNLCKASAFFDPTHRIFQVMKEKFPKSPFDSIEWRDLLNKIGMVNEVNDQMFVRYAQNVAYEAQHSRSSTTDVKSRALVEHLFGKEQLSPSLLNSVRDIKFITPVKVTENLSNIVPQLGDQGSKIEYVRFKDSVPVKFSHIVWTTAFLLPTWANPQDYTTSSKEIDQICHSLQIQMNPTQITVAKHCQNICESLVPKEHSSVIGCSEILTGIMKMIYEYFVRIKDLSEDICEILSNTCCICVEKGERLVFPKQVVRELTEEGEIKPYLYKIPLELGSFVKLFEKLGMEPTVTPNQFADVLCMIYKDSGGQTLHPNEATSTKKAVEGLLLGLEKKKNALSIPDLFLPATVDLKHVKLVKVSLLVLLDKRTWYQRLKSYKEKMFLANILEVDSYQHRKLIKLLPDPFKVEMVSELVQETLEDSCKAKWCDHEFSTLYNKKLPSETFFRGLLELLKSKCNEKQEKLRVDLDDEQNVFKFREVLSNTRIFAVEKCTTYLETGGKRIEDSGKTVRCFILKLQKRFEVYFAANHSRADVLHDKIEELLREIISNTMGIRIDKIPMSLVTCPLNQIPSVLEELGLENIGSQQEAYIPECGTFIPIEDHHLLKNDFTDFYEEEYVGYETADPVMNDEVGDPTYIYAQIVQKLPNPGKRAFEQKYKIRIDERNTVIEVYSTDLYKFCRMEEFAESGSVVVYVQDDSQSGDTQFDSTPTAPPHPTPPAPPRSLSEVKEELTDLLEEAWKLPEDQRKKVTKRLFLKWHPDKNHGNEAFCTEVFKYLQNEIKRLQEGRPRSKRNEESSSTHSSSYDTFFDFMNRRARSHHFYREEYRRTYHENSYSSREHHNRRRRTYNVPPSFSKTNPQQTESRRWMSQAKEDLRAVQSDKIQSSHEWACLKCYQAAVKALVSCQFAVDANKCSGISYNRTTLLRLAEGLRRPAMVQLVMQLQSLLGRHASNEMCYPDSSYAPRLPNQYFTVGMSDLVFTCARKIVELATDFLNETL